MVGISTTAIAKMRGMPAVGSLFAGRYRLRRIIGEGGMGCVFEGVHERLGRGVAIKVLRPELATEHEHRTRFEREARASASLKNEHSVRVFDVDVTSENEGSMMYIVMELLSGRDLGTEAQIVGQKLDHRDLVEWISQTCEALTEAHKNGIIHRDIKPANIFLAEDPDGGGRNAKVVDFGISKFSEQITSALTKAGRTGEAPNVLGTPHYMAPEQLRGHRIDGRADLWALGVTMFRVLGGRLPFYAEHGDGAYLSAVLTDPPYQLEELRPDLPHDFCAVIMRTLEKLPSDRYASTEDLADALSRFGWWASGGRPETAARGKTNTTKTKTQPLPDPDRTETSVAMPNVPSTTLILNTPLQLPVTPVPSPTPIQQPQQRQKQKQKRERDRSAPVRTPSSSKGQPVALVAIVCAIILIAVAYGVSRRLPGGGRRYITHTADLPHAASSPSDVTSASSPPAPPMSTAAPPVASISTAAPPSPSAAASSSAKPRPHVTIKPRPSASSASAPSATATATSDIPPDHL
jgi:serine/threonine protein kinase